MKIDKIHWQSRRDFSADLKCEFCGAVEEKVSCYDDSYFHKEVVPSMGCKKCGKSSGIPTSSPKYDDSVQI